MSQTCPVCGDAAHSRPITVRGGKAMTLWNCAACDFDFFDHDPTTSLVADKLDQTRLKAAGLDIPTVERDFANGSISTGACAACCCLATSSKAAPANAWALSQGERFSSTAAAADTDPRSSVIAVQWQA